jgi:hypothetical protein
LLSEEQLPMIIEEEGDLFKTSRVLDAKKKISKEMMFLLE